MLTIVLRPALPHFLEKCPVLPTPPSSSCQNLCREWVWWGDKCFHNRPDLHWSDRNIYLDFLGHPDQCWGRKMFEQIAAGWGSATDTQIFTDSEGHMPVGCSPQYMEGFHHCTWLVFQVVFLSQSVMNKTSYTIQLRYQIIQNALLMLNFNAMRLEHSQVTNLTFFFNVQMILMDRTEQLERWDDTENVTKTKRITALQEYSGKYLAAVELTPVPGWFKLWQPCRSLRCAGNKQNKTSSACVFVFFKSITDRVAIHEGSHIITLNG